MKSKKRVLVVGGSLIGLLAANLFHRKGWDVQVFERVPEDLEGRGAGITILPGLESAFQAAGVEETESSLGVVMPARIALDKKGKIVAEREFRQVMTSWGRLYESLKNIFPPERYRKGMALERVEHKEGGVTAVFTNGKRIDGDLLIGADGLRSTVRTQFLPDLKPAYCGYIAWRCLVDERELPAKEFETLFERYTVCVAPGAQAIAYPVPGPGYTTERGKRQFNVVWYHPVEEHKDLRRFFTDDSGFYHANGIPPALFSKRIQDEMVETAQRVLAPQFARALEHGRWHFFQPIFDMEPERLAFGRVAIVGDAAFVTRPHTAMGVPKGAGDVMALIRGLEGGDIDEALRYFEKERLRVGRTIVARGRYLGEYMEAQLKSKTERKRAEAARDPEKVMMETAAPLDYEALSLQS
ncbi:MAG: FAD-dependent monooxygenase [Burkholderiales bacterium]